MIDTPTLVKAFLVYGTKLDRADLRTISESFGLIFPDGSINPFSGKRRVHEMIAYPLMLGAIESGSEDLARRFHLRFVLSK